MRVNPTLLLLLFIATVFFSIPSECDGEIELEMVCPTSNEGFALFNSGIYPVDLKGWSVSDGEGYVTFTGSRTLGAREVLNVFSDTPDDWLQLESYVLFDDEGMEEDGFNLNDKGDELDVMDPEGNITYSFCYGDSEGDSPFQRIPKGHVALRNHVFGYPGETEEWILHVPGRTLYHFERTYEDCEVIPFHFPESDGEEILSQIQDAQHTIRISMYTFDNKMVASALRHALERGVEVRMLMEGAPAGGVDTEEVRVLTALWKSGADIKMICSQDSYKRYQYVHTKYAIIDDDVTIITSENWTDSAFSGNRGWGVCIIDEDCAGYVSDVFDQDFTDTGDLIPFRERYSTALAYVLEPYVPRTYGFDTYVADVTPIICPDYSYKSLKSYILSAESRIYSQQLNIQYTWAEGEDNPLQWMVDLGSRGVDSRLLVDVTYDSPYDTDNEDGYGLYTIYRDDPNIQLRYFQSDIEGMMHNKGMVVDDSVWIGSMNWTDNSITSNREMSVIIRSKEVARIYTDLFLDDWGAEFDGVVDLVVDVSEVTYGSSTTLDASGSSVPFGSEFSWDLDGDGEYERTGSMTDWRFYDDTECTLRVIDMDGNVYTKTFTIRMDGGALTDEDSGQDGFLLDGPVKYIPMVLLIGAIVLIRRWKMRNRCEPI